MMAAAPVRADAEESADETARRRNADVVYWSKFTARAAPRLHRML
jgi:hypothetical protein